MPTQSAKILIQARLRLSDGRGFEFGPGKAELMEHIQRTGSISEAAKAMEMSYMRAWTLVRSLEKGFGEPLVLKMRGGCTRGGATLSATGEQILQLYREMETASAAATRTAGERLAELLKR